MRIIAGKAKKRRLKSPGKLPVRPTADRVKESLFNILGDKVPHSRFADLFAGTGGVGIEALSRGADKVLFVEQEPRVARLLKENIELAALSARAEIMRCDVETALGRLVGRGENYDIIFADPPYRQGLATMVLNNLARHRIWRDNALVIIETCAKEELPAQVGVFSFCRREKYGDTALSFFKASMGED
ncbi:MAG: 16S rRNA (guanine(966)-N(2))-methyltransferase RsmD [Firmicutes bacterium]|nr:16S rRNA (guanine(966)-N(2))-methyltransferase RsmD [Bacillota bacterium]